MCLIAKQSTAAIFFSCLLWTSAIDCCCAKIKMNSKLNPYAKCFVPKARSRVGINLEPVGIAEAAAASANASKNIADHVSIVFGQHSWADVASGAISAKSAASAANMPYCAISSPSTQQHNETTLAAIEVSKDKTCGICLEIVVDKKKGENRFGILPNCTHTFCLKCIRTWRLQEQNFKTYVIRACPVCRIESDFVCPSTYWIDDAKEKKLMLAGYLEAMSGKNCKYFRNGTGHCPFGDSCFYKHALPNGELVKMNELTRRRILLHSSGDALVMERNNLYSFLAAELESRNEQGIGNTNC